MQLGVVNAARVVSVVPDPVGPASPVWRTCVPGAAPLCGLCPGAVVCRQGSFSHGGWWVSCGRLACADSACGARLMLVLSVWRVLLPWVFASFSYPPAVPHPQCCGPFSLNLPVLVLFVLIWRLLALVVRCSRCSFSRGCTPLTLRLSLPLCRGPSLCPLISRCPGVGLLVEPGGRRLSGATREGFWGCRGGEALSHVPEERFPCALRHGGLWGGVVGVVGGAREVSLEGVEAVMPPSPACSPAHLTQ